MTSITNSLITTTDGSTLARFVDDRHGIVGLWSTVPDDPTIWSQVFFPNGKVMLIQPRDVPVGASCLAARLNPPGVEWADYTFDATTGAVNVFNPLYDSNGCLGFFDPTLAVPTTSFSAVITMAADGKSFTRILPDGSVRTNYRIPTQ